jgi:hypothetical protein
MKLGWVPFAAFWTPEFVFTGTSIMGISPSSGKFVSHVDTWDSIQNQEFLSADAVKDLIAQILQVYRCAPPPPPPAAPQPPSLLTLCLSVSLSLTHTGGGARTHHPTARRIWRHRRT